MKSACEPNAADLIVWTNSFTDCCVTIARCGGERDTEREIHSLSRSLTPGYRCWDKTTKCVLEETEEKKCLGEIVYV